MYALPHAAAALSLRVDRPLDVIAFTPVYDSFLVAPANDAKALEAVVHGHVAPEAAVAAVRGVRPAGKSSRCGT